MAASEAYSDTKKELKPCILRNGYVTVELFRGSGHKRALVHRLVAEAFIENTRCLPQVNHIDEVKTNNSVENLEWVSAKENMNYGTRLQRQLASIDYTSEARKAVARRNGQSVSCPVLQVLNGCVVNRFASAKAASVATGANHSHICECANGKRYKTVAGYGWRHEGRDDLLGFQF